MQIEHIEDKTRSDFGGSMIVTAKDAADKMDAIKHFRLFGDDPIEAAKVLTSKKPFKVTKSPGFRDNAAWFLIEDSLPVEFSTPYFETLHKRTGYEGRGILPDIPAEVLTPYYPWKGLHHTHYLRKIWTEHGHICFSAITHSRDWNNRKAGERAPGYAMQSIKAEIGDTRHEPEFIPSGGWGNQMKPNPNYLRMHAPHAAFKCEWFWHALVNWWLDNEASPAQKELVKTSGEIMKKNHNGVSGLHCIRPQEGVRTAWDEPITKWEDFKKL